MADKEYNFPKNRQKHKVITLCGSTRFKNEFMKVAERLTYDGYIVLMPHIFSKYKSKIKSSGEEGESKRTISSTELLNMHFDRIDMSDEIFVINKNGYIGEGTRCEIAYAEECGKGVKYLEVEKVYSDLLLKISNRYGIDKDSLDLIVSLTKPDAYLDESKPKPIIDITEDGNNTRILVTDDVLNDLKRLIKLKEMVMNG